MNTLSDNTSAIVVGSGVSGLCAAYALGKRGVNVTVLEKLSDFGGNGKYALTGVNLYGTSPQDVRGICDSATCFKKDILRAGLKQNDPRLVDKLVHGVHSAADLLSELDIVLTDVVNSGGHSVPRTHKAANWPVDYKPTGRLIVEQLLSKLRSMSNVSLRPKCNVSCLLTEDVEGGERAVVGVMYSDATAAKCSLKSRTVVLATGGYMADSSGASLLAEASASLCGLATSTGSHADGGGIRMAREAGGLVTGLKNVQLDPCGIINQTDPSAMHKDLCPSLVRSAGAILINSNGRRFCNELGSNKGMSEALLQTCPQHSVRLTSGMEQHSAFLLINAEVLSHIEKDAASVLQHPDAGVSFGTIRMFCDRYSIPAEALQHTFDQYAHSAISGRDEFGKITFPVKRFSLDDMVWVLEVTPVLHHGNGGIEVNASSEVLREREDGILSVLMGLYAVGECTGGLHGAERLSGNGLLESIVFGLNAGRRAADTCLNSPTHILTQWTPLTLRHRCKMDFLTIKGLTHITKEGEDDVPTDLYEFSFELPSTFSTLEVPPGGAVAVRACINGTEIVRHYTPVSRTFDRGRVDLFLKALPDHGMMSRHLAFLRPGDVLEFQGPSTFPNMRYAASGLRIYPKKMVMLAGGSGVAPMISMIRDVLHRGVDCKMVLFWGVEGQRDLVFRGFLDDAQRRHPDQLKVVYCVSQTLLTIVADHLHLGQIDTGILRHHLLPAFGPTEDVSVVICGPPKMSVAMMQCLGTMGYHDDHVFSYNGDNQNSVNL